MVVDAGSAQVFEPESKSMFTRVFKPFADTTGRDDSMQMSRFVVEAID
jgi:hypothetical protein